MRLISASSDRGYNLYMLNMHTSKRLFLILRSVKYDVHYTLVLAGASEPGGHMGARFGHGAGFWWGRGLGGGQG